MQRDPSAVARVHAVADAVRSSLQTRMHEMDAELAVDGDAEIQMAPAHLHAALLALVTNALQHTREGVPPRIRIRVGPGARGVEVGVIDNGPGIPADHRVSVFGLYRHLDPLGDAPGVGLALVRRIVDEYGGDARIDEGPGGGTCVTLALPGRAPTAP